MHHITLAQYQNLESWSKRGYTCLLIPNRAGYQLIPYRWRWFANLTYRIRLIWEAITFSYLRTVPHTELVLYLQIYRERLQRKAKVAAGDALKDQIIAELTAVVNCTKDRISEAENIALAHTYSAAADDAQKDQIIAELTAVANRMRDRKPEGKDIALVYTYSKKFSLQSNFKIAYLKYSSQGGRKDFFVGKFLRLIPPDMDVPLETLQNWKSKLDSNPRTPL